MSRSPVYLLLAMLVVVSISYSDGQIYSDPCVDLADPTLCDKCVGEGIAHVASNNNKTIIINDAFTNVGGNEIHTPENNATMIMAVYLPAAILFTFLVALL